MLVIRAGQMEAFRRLRSAELADRLLLYLTRERPAEAARRADPELLTLVQVAIARARRWGIVAERDLQRFLDLVLRYGPQFGDRQSTPWAVEVLEHPELYADQKLNLLEGYALYGASREGS